LPIKSQLKLALLSFFILYSFIVSMAKWADYKAEQGLREYTDGQANVRSNEMSPEAEVALDRFAQDTARRFAPITGFLFSSLYVSIFFGMVNLFSIAKKKLFEKRRHKIL
jgi:hypothetical protein